MNTNKITLDQLFIDELPKTHHKIINEYLHIISSEIAKKASIFGIQKAREEANKKYGKFWRERLNNKKSFVVK